MKAKGPKEIMEGLYKRQPHQTKYTYKGVEVTEDGTGAVSVRKEQTKTGHWTDEANDDVIIDEYVDREIGFEIKPQYDEMVHPETGEMSYLDDVGERHIETKIPDEYNESTAYLKGDPEGGAEVDEVLEVIDDADHLELKEIADEVIDLPIRKKKASGGLAYMLGE